MSRDLFDPRTVMDSEYDRSAKEGNFAFAFNDSNFSDRVLRIEIMAGPSYSKSDADGCCSLFDWARNRKRRREDLKKDVQIDNDTIEGLFLFPFFMFVLHFCFYFLNLNWEVSRS